MTEQKVVRTYLDKYYNPTKSLDRALEEGYKVKHITKLDDGVVEYIVEKQDYPTNDNINNNIKTLKEMGIVQMD